ncbi:uncharacterized protein [Drosophila kikkawai]|uniref:DNA/RNA non-specific endonuclease/pyrophosphatase/phosphodiesterase domain-containing protein n=1 Tax=Drosophila kikkawai TaxID=30033 RepID=A0A6P4J8J3_DROKI|nr:uncharacterized protein LOC108080999 [Drosophila kikkawai]
MWRQLLPILALCAMAQAQCRFTRADVERTTRIFMVRLPNRQLSLKRTASSPVGEVLQMWCSPQDIRQTTCQRNQRNVAFRPPLPMTCQRPPAALTTPVPDRSCPATMYRVGYNVGNNQFLELYRACFDRRSVRAVFVEHRVYAKTFFAQRPCVQFSSDGVISPADEASYTTRNIYATFRRLFGNQQNFIANNQDVVINRGHLAASADFLFGDQMCSTFKYVNAVPQFKAINDGNWEAIERWVRNSVTGNQFVNVRTGARDVLSLPSSTGPKNVFLSGNRNPVPLWMYKIVRDSNNRPLVAFLTLNNIFARQRPAAPAFCQAVNCPINLPNNARSGFTFCCNPATFRP